MNVRNSVIVNKDKEIMSIDNKELNLIRKAQKGDEQAIDELYTKYKHYVASICHKYYLIGGDEDDLMQEGMLGFFKAINTFDFENHEFLPYAKTLIHNQIVNAIKRANSGKAGFLNESIQLNNQGEIVVEEKNKVFGLPNSTFTPEQEVLSSENHEFVLKFARENLSEFENDVLMFYLQGFDYKDIMQKLNTNYKSVDNALSRIKNKFKKLNMGD